MRNSVPGTVLVVDDNEVNRILLLRQLERLGQPATAATSGGQALEAVLGSEFALVFMDCRMPGMDGLETTRRIREAEAGTGRRIPIVALTANAMEGDREACMAAGMDGYLTKPVMLEGLEAVLRRFALDPHAHGPAPAALERLQKEREDDTVTKQLVRTYLTELPGRVRAIHQAIEGADARALVLAAHTLKSTSALFEAPGLVELCARLEAAGRAGSTDELREMLRRLDGESAAVRVALEGSLAGRAGG